jgi:aldehyde dehydrogenase (NAD+)
VAAQYQLVDHTVIDGTLAAAHLAQAEWVKSAYLRSAAIHAWADSVEHKADLLTDLLVREVGKPIGEATGEVERGIAILRYYAQAVYDPIGEDYPSPDGRARIRVARVPLGVVGIVTPWNFPLAIPLWKIAPAIAYGNAVVWKPSSLAMGISLEIQAAADQSLPKGVVALLPIAGQQAGSLIDDPRLDGLSFTGSAAVGIDLAGRASKRGMPMQAEMGGQNPSIVLDDADLDYAATTIAGAAMAYAGQKCTATSRIVVSKAVASRFVPLLVDHVRSLTIGEPANAETVVGPLISEDARAEVTQAIGDARSRGATCLTGGDVLDREGWFLEPTILSIDDSSDPIAQEETFGPVASVLLFADPDDAIRVANSTKFGLSAAVFGSDVERAARLGSRLVSGLVRINASTTGVDFYAPFGGKKSSGYGPRELGRAARDFYTSTRTVVINDPAIN